MEQVSETSDNNFVHDRREKSNYGKCTVSWELRQNNVVEKLEGIGS